MRNEELADSRAGKSLRSAKLADRTARAASIWPCRPRAGDRGTGNPPPCAGNRSGFARGRALCADPANLLSIDERGDLLGEIALLSGVLRLAGEEDGLPAGLRDADGAERILRRRHAAEEGQVLARGKLGIVRLEIAPIVDDREFAA